MANFIPSSSTKEAYIDYIQRVSIDLAANDQECLAEDLQEAIYWLQKE